MSPAPKLSSPERHQVGFHAAALDDLIDSDHRARIVWNFVERVDLSALYGEVASREGGSGRPATDARLLLALWLYATIDGVGSGRRLARLCDESLPYRWLCGGVSVNYHTLSDFRIGHRDFLSDLLTRSVAALMAQGLVQMERVAQDGMRTRASAGAASFRRRSTLRICLEEAREQVAALEKELAEDPGAGSRRSNAARQRAANERAGRVAAALAAAESLTDKDDDSARSSTTDPEAKVMKMADGGFRPAYNVQFTTDTATGIIVATDVSNSGSDLRQLVPALQEVAQRYGRVPTEHLVDGGYANFQQIEAAAALGTTVYAPVQRPRNPNREPEQSRPRDSQVIAEWRQRMGTEEAKAIYQQRAATAELTNAQARNRGLRQIPVRGLGKAASVALWFALAHNLMRSMAL